jgi:spermidine/putrescine transport system ATP-binding protein
VLRLEGISKSFDSVPVLEEIDLEVASGEFVAILGPSGCGKTTLLRILAGLEIPDAGRVFLGGREVGRLPANQRPINTVFQSYALFPHLTVYENIAFGLRSRRCSEDEIRRRVGEAMEMLRVGELNRRQPHLLSGGQKQRVALARALVNEPEVLLLDEPMSALDARLRADVQIELRRLQRRLEKTFILVTHDQDEAMTVADRLVVMNAGRIEQAGRPREIYEKPFSRFVAEFIGSANLIPAEQNGKAHELGLVTPLGVLVVTRKPDWQRGTLAIRPERIAVRDTPPRINGIQVAVRDWVYRGDHLDIWVEPGPLRLRTSPLVTVSRDQPLWIELPPDHLEILVD